MRAVCWTRRTAPSLLLVILGLLIGWPTPLIAVSTGLPAFTELVRTNSPAVVNISTSQTPTDTAARPRRQDPPEGHPSDDFLDRFLDERTPRPPRFGGESLGSGFIISEDGLVLTNNHVVRNADEITVRLSDRREFVARVVGTDERSDLALLRIDADSLPVVRIGRSSALEVGEWVLAIGSPFGFEHSATAGIVSAKGRSLPSENYIPFIQTDVAINPGNSGGPLFNLEGEVVALNSHIYSRTGGFQGVSFAIPIELAMDVVAQLEAKGSVSRGWLGVVIQDVTRELAESFGMERPAGALVARVVPDSPAARAGLSVGDVIVRYDGRDVPSSGALPPMVGRTAVGERVPVGLLREGDPREIDVLIAELPDSPGNERAVSPAPSPAAVPELGLRVAPLPDDRRRALDRSADGPGVLVTDVHPGPGRRAGIEAGDVILLLDRDPVRGVDDFRDRVAALAPGASLSLLVAPSAGGPRFLALRLPD